MKGRIEQLGSPQEVYEQPRTPFVEDFLGRVLRFRGTIVEQGLDAILVDVDEGARAQLRIETTDDTFAVGDCVLVAIRPEQVLLQDSGTTAPRRNILRCTIESVLYLGAECELVLRHGQTVCTLQVSRAAVPESGNSLDLYLPVEHLHVWHEPASSNGPPRPDTDDPD